ncbi:Crp/Fnr family transcriptional regulator [Hyunsoonleella pacifica]|uniref:Crp/Fnr family transcriptional regulator n=1 Tax=Hyunsoonleella pacifica TaxID=1080224 RepID=A0A4Q9FQ93_9FLAO|nr:Crp/Fnr family transcriptional regulator [Hyunsoonleella pacifica]TBN17611.1 Crp/Fnr family transcriptional regulator [Hyunsoonleella pacifica]GGD10426.1 cAMP-binding protein [Hyunsoonleella pacifica]
MFNNDEFLDAFGHIPEDTFLKFKGISQFKKIDANTQLDELGKVPSKLYLIISGVMRCYVISESGKEFNKRFFFTMDFAGSLTALIKNAPSEIVYETITQCTLYEIDYKELREMCATDIIVSNLYTSMLEKVFMRYEKRQLELISLNASQRYLKLKSDIPEIDKLVPQYHIASYLSITPVQLSRIRKKLKES